MLVYCDIDGVVSDFLGHLIASARSEGFSDVPDKQDWTEWAWYEHNGSRRDEFVQFMNDAIFSETQGAQKFWETMPILEGAFDAFVNGFCPDAILTSREVPEEWTEHWFEENVYPLTGFIPIMHASGMRDKWRYLSKRDVIIDDNPAVISSVRENGLRYIIIDQPYNKHLGDDHRADDLMHAAMYHAILVNNNLI